MAKSFRSRRFEALSPLERKAVIRNEPVASGDPQEDLQAESLALAKPDAGTTLSIQDALPQLSKLSR